MTATAALTAQNTQGVYDIHETPSDFVEKQIDACIEDIGVDVLKTGVSTISTARLPNLEVLIFFRHAGFGSDGLGGRRCYTQAQDCHDCDRSCMPIVIAWSCTATDF